MRLRMSLTQKCNLACVFCSKEGLGKREQTMDSEDYKFVIRSVRKYFDEIDFTGGEPTLSNYLVDLIKEAKDNNYFTWMDTNGIKLGKDIEYCKRLKEAGLDRITISVLATDQQIYNDLTGANGKLFYFNQQGLKNAVKLFGKNVDINTVFTKKNSQDMINILKLAEKLSVDLRVLELVGKYDKTNNLYVPISEFKQIMNLNGGTINKKTCDEEYFVNGIKIMIRLPAGLGEDTPEPDFVWLTPDGYIKNVRGEELYLLDEIKSRNKQELEKKINKFLNL